MKATDRLAEARKQLRLVRSVEGLTDNEHDWLEDAIAATGALETALADRQGAEHVDE